MPKDSMNIEKLIKTYLLNTCVFNVNPENKSSPIIFTVIRCEIRCKWRYISESAPHTGKYHVLFHLWSISNLLLCYQKQHVSASVEHSVFGPTRD
jgi:hypothetical protein